MVGELVPASRAHRQARQLRARAPAGRALDCHGTLDCHGGKECPPQPPKEKWEADIPSPADEDFKSWELACEATNNIKPNRTLISDITADAIGELFIYVNDAVLALSGLTDVFYRNNSGTAKVTVTRVLADSIVESPAEGK